MKHYIVFLSPHAGGGTQRWNLILGTYSSLAMPLNQPQHLDFFVKNVSDLHTELSMAQFFPGWHNIPIPYIPLFFPILYPPSYASAPSKPYPPNIPRLCSIFSKCCTFNIHRFKLRIWCVALSKQATAKRTHYKHRNVVVFMWTSQRFYVLE